MAYIKRDPEFKWGIVFSLWKGKTYSQLSQENKIPRATIYRWEIIAKDAALQAFEKATPGKKTTDLEEENKKLREQLSIMYHDKHSEVQETPEPLVCSHCGSSHIKKNGTVLTKRDGLRQRYTCLACSTSVYLDVKKTPTVLKSRSTVSIEKRRVCGVGPILLQIFCQTGF